MIYFSRFFRRGRKSTHPVQPGLKYLMMMKLTFLLIFGLSVGVLASGKAQNVSIDMKNVPLEEVLEEVSKQSKLRLFYDPSIVKNLRISRLSVSNVSVSSIT